MRHKIGLAAALLALIFVFSCPAWGFSLSAGGNAGGFSEEVDAGSGDSVFSHTVISRDALSNEISSSGNLRERHWISDGFMDRAEVGVDIRNAQRYDYSYMLNNGPNYASAVENLDVTNARSIYAYAMGDNAAGDLAGASISISDSRRRASLSGYSNYADARFSYDTHSSSAGQGFSSASGDRIAVEEHSLQSDGDKAFASMNVVGGSISYFNGHSFAGLGHSSGYYLPDEGGDHETSSWDYAMVDHRADITGKGIDVWEHASQRDGDVACAVTRIDVGILDDYGGYASAGTRHDFRREVPENGSMTFSNTTQESSVVSHDISAATGRGIIFQEMASQADGDEAGACLMTEGSLGAYSGAARTTIRDYESRDGQSYYEGSWNASETLMSGILTGRNTMAEEWARSAGGDISVTSANIRSGSMRYNGASMAGAGRDIRYSEVGVAENVLNGTRALENFDISGTFRMNIFGLAVNSEGQTKCFCERLNPSSLNGTDAISYYADVINGVPFAGKSVDWLPHV